MAKGQVRKNKEARKPKKEKPKTIAANQSQKGGQRAGRPGFAVSSTDRRSLRPELTPKSWLSYSRQL